MSKQGDREQGIREAFFEGASGKASHAMGGQITEGPVLRHEQDPPELVIPYPDGQGPRILIHPDVGVTVADVLRLDHKLNHTDQGKLFKVAAFVQDLADEIFDGHLTPEEPDEDYAEPYCFECSDPWPCKFAELHEALKAAGF